MMMNILVGNYHLAKTGGTENYTYAIIVELLRLGHKVEYFTLVKGEISDKIEKLGVKFKSRSSYDLIIANHKTIVNRLYTYGCIIQTCHGTIPEIEQPSGYADFHVAISFEVQQHLKSLNVESVIIHNGIDCNRFFPEKKIHDSLTSVLSLCQSDVANSFIAKCCNTLGIEFKKLDKHIENLWEVEKSINNSDLVVGIGRSLYDAMACGRTVISYDNRDYSKDLGDGYLNIENIEESLKYNCSGRSSNKSFTEEQFIEELKKYNKSDGNLMRNFALENLNIELVVQKYLNIFSWLDLVSINLKKRLKPKYLFIKNIFFSNK